MDVGVIGTGIMGQNHVRVFSELRGISNLIIYDLNTQAAQAVAKKNDVERADSIDSLLRNVDAVSICVPTPFHFEVSQKALDAGVHMMIEKPICATAGQAKDLGKLITDDLIVGVGHIERFNPIISEICRIIKNPLYVEMKRHNPASSRISMSTIVEDLMIHDIDIVVNSFFNIPYKLSCSGNNDICAALFKFNGFCAFLSASRKSSKKIRTVYIEEEDCTIEGDFMNQEIYIHRKPDQYSIDNERYVQENIIEKVLVNKVEPLKVELGTFIDCIKNDTQFPVTPDQAIHNLVVCEEIIGMCSH